MKKYIGSDVKWNIYYVENMDGNKDQKLTCKNQNSQLGSKVKNDYFSFYKMTCKTGVALLFPYFKQGKQIMQSGAIIRQKDYPGHVSTQFGITLQEWI